MDMRNARCPWSLLPRILSIWGNWILILSFICELGSLPAQADFLKCEICGQYIKDNFFILVTDQVRNVKKNICNKCNKSDRTCTLCKLPIVDTQFTDLGDGRIFCSLDSKDLVLSDAQAEELWAMTKIDLQRFFAQWAPVPDQGISLHVASQKEFENAHRDDPNTPDAEGWLGATYSSKGTNGAWRHTILIKTGLGVSQFLAVAAHEGAHIWLQEHGQRTTTLHPDAREGFCEFVAHRLMAERGSSEETKRIEKNTYSKGQVGVFLQAESQYNTHRVFDWVLNGVDRYLDSEKIDRLLALQPGVVPLHPEAPKSKPAAIVKTQTLPENPAVETASAKSSDELILRGITQSRGGALAMINNRTLAVGEEGKVRCGESNIVVRCLSIEKGQVTVQVQGNKQPQKLALRGN